MQLTPVWWSDGKTKYLCLEQTLILTTKASRNDLWSGCFRNWSSCIPNSSRSIVSSSRCLCRSIAHQERHGPRDQTNPFSSSPRKPIPVFRHSNSCLLWHSAPSDQYKSEPFSIAWTGALFIELPYTPVAHCLMFVRIWSL